MHLTITAWAVYIIFAIVTIIAGVWIGSITVSKKYLATIIVVIIAIDTVALFGFNWYYTHTASGARAIKTQQSELFNGVYRVVTVYDVTGNIIKTYEGKFDVTYDNDRILFDDENGLRHIIYYPTGTVIVDEVEQ